MQDRSQNTEQVEKEVKKKIRELMKTVQNPSGSPICKKKIKQMENRGKEVTIEMI